MAEQVSKSLALMFSPNDDNQFEAGVRKLVPTICVIDGSVWPSTEPNVKPSLAECESPIVYLWDPKVCPNLPFQKLDDGRARGPTSGVVIQYLRPQYDGKTLISGEISTGYKKTNVAMALFDKAVWKVAKSMNSATLCSFNKDTGKILKEHINLYVVGPDAARLSKEKGVLLQHYGAVDVHFRAV
jgi:hypothetical protein